MKERHAHADILEQIRVIRAIRGYIDNISVKYIGFLLEKMLFLLLCIVEIQFAAAVANFQ